MTYRRSRIDLPSKKCPERKRTRTWRARKNKFHVVYQDRFRTTSVRRTSPAKNVSKSFRVFRRTNSNRFCPNRSLFPSRLYNVLDMSYVWVSASGMERALFKTVWLSSKTIPRQRKLYGKLQKNKNSPLLRSDRGLTMLQRLQVWDAHVYMKCYYNYETYWIELNRIMCLTNVRHINRIVCVFVFVDYFTRVIYTKRSKIVLISRKYIHVGSSTMPYIVLWKRVRA